MLLTPFLWIFVNLIKKSLTICLWCDLPENLYMKEIITMGCFYCDEHHEGREAIMFKVGDMKAGTLYLFKDQAHKGRCALALKSHKKELCECDEQERNDYCADLAAASGAIKKLWGCTKINLGSFGDSNPHLHFHIVPKYEGGFEFGGSFAITNPEPVILKDEEYKEMIEALQKELGL